MLIEFADVMLASVLNCSSVEGSLHESLAVVEGPFDLQRSHVSAERGELSLLEGAHLVLWEENEGTYGGDVQKRVCYSASGVTRGRDENGSIRGVRTAEELVEPLP